MAEKNVIADKYSSGGTWILKAACYYKELSKGLEDTSQKTNTGTPKEVGNLPDTSHIQPCMKL